MNQGLTQYMDQMGFKSVNEIVGELYKNVTSFDRLLKESKSEKVAINEATCTGCNICVVACDDAGYDALLLKEIPDAVRTKGARKVAELIYDNCTGCNLCVALCPVPECMTLYDSKEPFPYELHTSYAGNTLI